MLPIINVSKKKRKPRRSGAFADLDRVPLNGTLTNSTSANSKDYVNT